MNQIQVNVVQLQLLEAFINCVGYVGYVGHDFCRHEEFGSFNLALFDGHAHFRLCVVYFGIVEVIIAKLDGSIDAIYGLSVDAARGGFVPSGPRCFLSEQWMIVAIE